MTSLNPPLSRGISRRGSAVGLLNADDENVHGDNATKYGKKKGSFLTRVKQNVGQKIEAAKTKKISIQSRSGHYSAEKECDSDEWESEDDFDDAAAAAAAAASQQATDDQLSFDFPNAFDDNDGGEKSKQPLDLSQHSFFDDANNGSEQVAGQSTTPTTANTAAKSSKARGHRRAASLDDNLPQQKAEVRRKSNDNLLSRRLEDANLTKIKYGEESSILQFDPMKMQKSLPGANDDSKKEEGIVEEEEEEDPLSRLEQFTLDANGGDKKKRGKIKKKVRRNNSLPSEKILQRAQRRSTTQPSTTTDDDPQDAGRLAPPTRKVRRTKSSDDTPFDMSDVVESEKKPKKRNARSPKRSSSSNHSNKSAMNSSSHHSKGIINSSSHHSKSKRASAHKKKGDSTTKSKPASPTQLIQSSTLDVRF